LKLDFSNQEANSQILRMNDTDKGVMPGISDCEADLSRQTLTDRANSSYAVLRLVIHFGYSYAKDTEEKRMSGLPRRAKTLKGGMPPFAPRQYDRRRTA